MENIEKTESIGEKADKSLVVQGIEDHKKTLNSLIRHIVVNYIVFLGLLSWFIYVISQVNYTLIFKLLLGFFILYVFSKIFKLRDRIKTTKGLIVMMEDMLKNLY